MALVTPYADIAYADVVLASSTVWTAASDDEKNNALFWGRIYIDTNYSCSTTIDEDDPSDEIKTANSLLAEDYLDGTLIEDTDATIGEIEKKRVKAGSVESETVYSGSGRAGNPQDDVDMLMDSHSCVKISGNSQNIVRA